MMPNDAGLPVLSLHCNCGGCLQVLLGYGNAVGVLQTLLQSATAKLEELAKPKPFSKPTPLFRSRRALQRHFEEQRDRCTLSACPNTPTPKPPLPLLCGSVTSAWVVCSLSVRCADDFRTWSATVCLGRLRLSGCQCLRRAAASSACLMTVCCPITQA